MAKGSRSKEVSMIIKAGNAAFGDSWQSELARQLRISDRTIRRWCTGVNDPSIGVLQDVLKVLKERQALIAESILEIEAIKGESK